MANSAAELGLDPEIESAKKLLQVLEDQRGNPELLIKIIDFLGNPTSTLEEFLQQLLEKINELIPSDSSLIGLVISQATTERPRIAVKQRDHPIGAWTGNHDHVWSDFLVGGEELAPDQRSFIGYVAFKKLPLIVNDIQQWKNDTGFYREVHQGTNSEIAVPILFEDRDVLGVINLESAEKDHYKEEHKFQLQWVARMISRVLDAFMNRAGYRKPYLTVLDRIHKELGELRINTDRSHRARKYLSEDSKAIFDSIATRIAVALNSERCEIWVLPKDQGELHLEGQHGTDGLAEDAITIGLGMAKEMMIQKTSLYVDAASSPNGEHLLIAPLMVSGRAYGVIRVMTPKISRGPNRYTVGDERLLDVLQQSVAVAIHQKHLEWERRASAFKRGEDVAALLDMIAGIDLDFDTVLQQACGKILQLCDAAHCTIFILDDETGRFVRKASSNLPKGFINKPSYEPGEGLTGWVGQHGLPLNLRTRHDQDLANIQPRIDWNLEEKLRHKDLINRPFIAVPVQLKGRTVGVLRCTDKCGEHVVFTEADEHILLLIAAHIATAIAFHQRYEGETKLLNQVKLILDLIKDQPLANPTHLFADTLLNEILDSARNIFGADVAIIYRYKDGKLLPQPIKSGELIYKEYFGYSIEDDSIIYEVLNNNAEIRYFPDAMNDPSLTEGRPSKTAQQGRGRFVIREGICSSLATKIGSSGCPSGVLFLNYRKHPRTFDRHFVELLKAFTGITSVCLDLFETHMDSMEIAAHLHNAVIPELVRDVVADAGIGTIHLSQENYETAGDCFYAIESSAQKAVAALSEVVTRLATRFTWSPEPL